MAKNVLATKCHLWLHTYCHRVGARDEQRDRFRASCAGLSDRARHALRPSAILGPAIREPEQDLIVFASGEGGRPFNDAIEEAPVAGGQAAQGGQAERASCGICRGASHEI